MLDVLYLSEYLKFKASIYEEDVLQCGNAYFYFYNICLLLLVVAFYWISKF